MGGCGERRYGEGVGRKGVKEGGRVWGGRVWGEKIWREGVGRREDMERGVEWEVWRGGCGEKGREGVDRVGVEREGVEREGMGREDIEGGCGEERRYGGRVLSNVLDSK